MLSLAFTSNKQAIRQLWDKPIIADFSAEIQKPLDYFGLPGPDIQDLVDWNEYLGLRTGVEYLAKRGKKRDEQLRKISCMQSNVMLKGLNTRWQLRKGSLEDIILDGVDIDGNKPALLHVDKKHPPKMTYDIHNWDFQSGLGYRNQKREAKRIEAIKRCIGLQKHHPFLFLLTLNVRHGLGGEPSLYLQGIADELQSPKHQEILLWYSERTASKKADRYRTKAIVPLIVRQAAQLNSFDCHCYSPIYYQGVKEHLLHFVFSLRPKGTMLPAYSTQHVTEVIELPLIIVNDGQFEIAPEQHPCFDLQNALNLLTKHGLPGFKQPRLSSHHT